MLGTLISTRDACLCLLIHLFVGVLKEEAAYVGGHDLTDGRLNQSAYLMLRAAGRLAETCGCGSVTSSVNCRVYLCRSTTLVLKDSEASGLISY